MSSSPLKARYGMEVRFDDGIQCSEHSMTECQWSWAVAAGVVDILGKA